jgi:hypothetical protein
MSTKLKLRKGSKRAAQELDSKGLGRWIWILLGGTNGHNTRVITAYNPCKNRNVNLGTTYQQQQRYFITKKKDLTCPLIPFRNHLIKQMKEWRAAGDRIILFMDHNKHVINGQLGKALADKEGLDLQEAIVQHTGTSPARHFSKVPGQSMGYVYQATWTLVTHV